MCLVCIILALQRLVNLFVWENLFMNKVFKIIWNKTTQSFVVTSELAKGAVKASSNSEQRVTSETRLSSLFKLSVFALSLSAVMMPAQANVIVGDGSNAPTNVHPFSIAVGTVPHQQAVEVLPLLVMA